ncbi:hypothetical protein [Aulosira sp. FACHB-615]|uniref:hypothetical protein n=1 Tax=Aulosira sp. FACHB-615 TaxID=2692777 RepID=UPI001682EC42|nr:hypothetical protein [Aulosira sp. FACHB-615]MBD2492483.1 hypothetical protein [Aulosira sp. FACHB-615]
MNYLWLLTFGFAFTAMFRLIQNIESRLKELNECDICFSYIELGDGVYRISPRPRNYELLRELSNVIWIEVKGDDLLIKAERLTTVEDIVYTLNSF